MVLIQLAGALLALAFGATALPLPVDAVALSSATGQDIFMHPDTLRNDFFKLSAVLATQGYESYCGVATTVSVLNAFGSTTIKTPIDPIYYPYRYYTQESVFYSDCALNISSPGLVQGMGMDLEQVASLLGCWGVEAKVHFADGGLTLDTMRETMVRGLTDPQGFVTINFDRQALNEEGSGHHSPIGAYSPATDQFLIMDVASFKYPPHWVRANRLLEALRGHDGVRRGFLVASPNTAGA